MNVTMMKLPIGVAPYQHMPREQLDFEEKQDWKKFTL